MNQEVIPWGRGLLAGILPNQSPCSAGILPGLCIWKSQYPSFPGPRGDVVANDWCIRGHLYAFQGLFLRSMYRMGNIFRGLLKFQIFFFHCLKFLIFFWLNGRCWAQAYVRRINESTPPPLGWICHCFTSLVENIIIIEL